MVFNGSFSGLFGHENVADRVLEDSDFSKLFELLQLNGPLCFARRVEHASIHDDLLGAVFVGCCLALPLNETSPGKTLRCF